VYSAMAGRLDKDKVLVCHTCATPLLSGDVGYSPAPLERPADGEVLICCAQPRADVVLDM
jgi:ferredoxin